MVGRELVDSEFKTLQEKEARIEAEKQLSAKNLEIQKLQEEIKKLKIQLQQNEQIAQQVQLPYFKPK